MQDNMSISQIEFARAWLEQFPATERATAARLADAVMLVSHDALYRGLRLLLDETLGARDEADAERPIALYAERAVETRKSKNEYGWETVAVPPFFPGAEKGRATGSGVTPVLIDPDDQEVGSEGAIANFITSYQRLHRDSVLSHPGPDALRDGRASHIVIVTDFIGSGKRVSEMVDAFVAGFADNEGTQQGLWQQVKEQLGDLLMRWPNGTVRVSFRGRKGALY